MTDDAKESGPQSPPTHRMVVVDGDRITPLCPEALVAAMFAAPPEWKQPQVLALAQAFHHDVEHGKAIELRVERIVRPDTNGRIAS